MCAKFGLDWFRNADLFKVQTKKLNKIISTLYIRCKCLVVLYHFTSVRPFAVLSVNILDFTDN
jgi:hypothetical protein